MSNDETNNEVRHILNDATRREVTLDSGKTIAVYEGTSTRGEMGKIAPWNQVNADAKRWRTQVLSFYGKAATFINNEGIINQIHGCAGETEYTTFEPCVLGKTKSCKDGLLEFETDRGMYYVKYGHRKELRSMLHKSKPDAVGKCATFCKLMDKSLKRHGWLKSGKPPVHSYTKDGVAFIGKQPKFDGGEK